MIEPHRHRGERQHQQHVAVARHVLGVALLGEDHRHPDDDRDLGELRRLDLEPRRQHDPRVRAVDGRADGRQHDDQAQARQHVDDRGVRAQRPVVDERGAAGQQHADDRVERVPLEERLRVEPGQHHALAGGRPDEQRAEHDEREDRQGQDRVEPAQRRLPLQRALAQGRAAGAQDDRRAHRRRLGSTAGTTSGTGAVPRAAAARPGRPDRPVRLAPRGSAVGRRPPGSAAFLPPSP